MSEFCEAVVAADPKCTSWIAEGHPWHGCSKPWNHNSGKKVASRRVHVCKCGLEWTSYKRRQLN